MELFYIFILDENGLFHNDNGPATITIKNGELDNETYYIHNKLIKDISYSKGDMRYLCYYENGQPHKEDGPAVIYKNGIEYYLNGNDFNVVKYYKILMIIRKAKKIFLRPKKRKIYKERINSLFNSFPKDLNNYIIDFAY